MNIRDIALSLYDTYIKNSSINKPLYKKKDKPE